MATNIPRGSVRGIEILEVTLSPATVATTTSAEQTFTVQGLRLHDFVWVNKPTTQAGLCIVGARVSAADTLAITFANVTSGTLTPTGSQVYTVFRCSPSDLPVPSAIA
ncbi:hypothetical protein UFOVP154_30 [uncultured Caudovirales phage]|uniref:Uncharacterized protein n=1 Tax=uncultured Caudovirales phage TaxID=2100421 RepID=A0A6J7W9M0_9CAUD|nr:hypothetical protein UFOVP8_15 [uncultured Caudovirales phage]CAB5170505.1 hypothetical protein UFOVP154_30 [uncultured Caudovirales phage]